MVLRKGVSTSKSKSKRLEALRIDPEGTGADACLCAGSSSRLVHSSLFLPYPFFRACLGENAAFAEAKRKEVVFEDISWDALQYLIAFVYDVDLPSDIPSEVLRNLWSFAAVHGMDDLQSSAAVVIEDRITAESALDWFGPAVSLKDSKVVRKASEAVFEHLVTAGLKNVAAEVSEFSHEEMTALRDWHRSINNTETDEEGSECPKVEGSTRVNEGEDDDMVNEEQNQEMIQEDEQSAVDENDDESGQCDDEESNTYLSSEAFWFRLVQIWSLTEAKDKAGNPGRYVEFAFGVKLEELSSYDLVQLANTWRATEVASRCAPVEVLAMVHDAMAAHLTRIVNRLRETGSKLFRDEGEVYGTMFQFCSDMFRDFGLPADR